MREIKFRAWDRVQKKMFQNVSTGTVMIWGGGIDAASSKDCDFMQFTGLHDKTGKEIYEGDIMSVLDRDWPSGDYTNQTPKEYMKKISSVCEVVYEPTEFYLKQIKGHGYFYPQMTGITHRDIFEVIGNIYENPELLT